jgi:Domain of unknown function (DUF4386)
MTFKLWDRWAPSLGILTVVCWALAFAVAGSNPSTDDSDSQITSYYMSHSHQAKQIAGFFIFMAGVLLFFGFLAALRRRLAAAEGPGGSLAALAFGAGVSSATLGGLALAFLTAPAFMTNDTGPANLDPKTYRMIGDLGYEIWVAAVIVGAVLVWATSALAVRTAVLPRWFGWLGLLVGLILLFAVVFLPAFVYAGWIVLAAALLTWLPARAASPAVPQAA